MKRLVEVLSSLKERQRVPVGSASAFTFLILFSAVGSLSTFKCVAWSKVLCGGQGDVLIHREHSAALFVPWHSFDLSVGMTSDNLKLRMF